MGTLYVVATPIGNLSDITDRARTVLGAVPIVLAEDTRRTGKLLKALGVAPRLESLHAHSGPRKLARVVGILDRGDAAYVTDAGTPAVSDPGAGLVAAARAAGHRIVPVPGPSALTAALSVAGIESSGAVFLGFLPRRSAGRRDLLERAARTELPVVIFCSPRTVDRTLEECSMAFGDDGPVVVCRELTKLHEEIVHSTVDEARSLEITLKQRGEYVLVLGPVKSDPGQATDEEIGLAVNRYRMTGLSMRDAAARAAEDLGISKSRAYEAGLRARAPDK